MRAITSNQFCSFWHRSPEVFIEGNVPKIDDRAEALSEPGSEKCCSSQSHVFPHSHG